ncbi:family 16 glycoside hydrolase [Flavivirga eckloniae]|uniref:3-keto-alpha-glucoside-1,2-lyase/3-keto-2-hydroxy-glucal hydratase domain-containing protein n=1 Tax=Flavivirga eckloniae TaxID=1803846 RepID=A0A2K9PTQ9_9FLAO|nr:family 16 glycoside hydrolase [Flavivirga eckloniae]AUP80429.1 hypothetical protein C1H87_17610 [Flavivirga eckloniae]
MKNKNYICYFIVALLSISSLTAQEQLWKGTFDGWEFGFRDGREGKGTRDDFWKIGPNGELHATGGNNYWQQSGMRTVKTYGDYELTLEYKWITTGEEVDGNSGIYIHGENNFAQDRGAFPNSIEVELKKGNAGAFIKNGLDMTATGHRPSIPVDPKSKEVPRDPGNSNIKITEFLDGNWNYLTIRSIEGKISVTLNGIDVNSGIVHKNGKRITSGYITLQSALKDIAFRNIQIKEIDACIITPYLYDKNPIVNGAMRQDDYAETEIGGTVYLNPAFGGLEGTVSWTGPNGFSHEKGLVIIKDIQEDDLGIYTVTFTGKRGCVVSHDFEVGFGKKIEIKKTAFLLSSNSSTKEQLWKGTFDGWEFGFRDGREGKGTRDDFWKIGPNGELHATGGNNYWRQSGMRTAKTYSDYTLTFEYKWITLGDGDKDGNSGIWIHGENNWKQDNGGYPNSIEVQLKKGEAGDLLRKGLEVAAEPNYPNVGSRPERLPKRFYSEQPIPEYTDGTWNKMSITVIEGKISVYLNDRLINAGTISKNGERVTSGYITFQSELKDLAFKNVYIEEIESCKVNPAVYDKHSIESSSTRLGDYAEVEIGGFALLAPHNWLEGIWSWTGPNGFSHEGKYVRIENVKETQLGIYTVTFTGKRGCTVSHDFEIGLNKEPNIETVSGKAAPKNIEGKIVDNNKIFVANATNDKAFTVYFNDQKLSSIVIYNAAGQEVYKNTLKNQGAEKSLFVNQNFLPGLYILLATDSKGNATSTKFLVN